MKILLWRIMGIFIPSPRSLSTLLVPLLTFLFFLFIHISESTKLMKLSEITMETDDEVSSFIHAETKRERIRKILEYQKSLYLSSVASSSSLSPMSLSSNSCSLPPPAQKSNDEFSSFIDTETQRHRIRKIIEYQKSLNSSLAASSSSSSLYFSANSCSLPSSARKSNCLFNLMRSGSTLKRLFDMEHTSLATYFEDYSGSPVTKPIFLCDSDAEIDNRDPWAFIKQFKPTNDAGIYESDRFSSKCSYMDVEFGSQNRKLRIGNHKLTRKKSFRRLPRFGLLICRGFRFRLSLRKKLRIVTCKRK